MAQVWITGVRGFLGGAVAQRFTAAGWSVVGLGRRARDPSLEANTTLAGSRCAAAVLHEGEISIAALEKLAEQNGLPDVLVHAAGSGTVGISLQDPLKDFTDAVGSTANVLEFLRRRAPAARIVLPSSAAVYGSHDSGPIAESAAVMPLSPYGHHKAAAELLCRSASRNFGQPCSVIRFFSLYGPGLRKQLLWDIVGRIARGTSVLELGGTGSETRDMLHVEDAAELVFLMASQVDSGFVLVNGGTGKASTVRSIAEGLIRALDAQVSLVFSGNVRPGDPLHQQADASLARSYSFAPKWTLAKGLDSYVSWYRSLPGAVPS